MAEVVYQPDAAGTRRLMQSTDMVAMVASAALKGKAYAEQVAPADTGEYQRSFQVDARVVGDRALAVLENTAPHAVLVEVYNNGGQRILGRTVDYIERTGP